MGDLDPVPAGWTVWASEPEGRVVLAYRPDVFDGAEFPAACLPTLTVAPGGSPDRPPATRGTADAWHVAVHLEPMVRLRGLDRTEPDRAAAIATARELAAAFAAGEVDYRAAYQDPRPAYLAALDRLTGREG